MIREVDSLESLAAAVGNGLETNHPSFLRLATTSTINLVVVASTRVAKASAAIRWKYQEASSTCLPRWIEGTEGMQYDSMTTMVTTTTGHPDGPLFDQAMVPTIPSVVSGLSEPFVGPEPPRIEWEAVEGRKTLQVPHAALVVMQVVFPPFEGTALPTRRISGNSRQELDCVHGWK